MATQQNSFALLSDDENDDFSSLLARAAATKVDAAPPAEKKQIHQKQKNEVSHEFDNRNDSVMIPSERGRGRGFRGRGRGMRRYPSGGNGFDGGQSNRNGRAGYDNYQQYSDVPNDQYPPVESEQGNGYGRDSARGNYRGRGRGRFGGRGRGYGRGRGPYGNQGPRYDNEEPERNPNENQVDDGDGGGWEQVKDFNSRDYRVRRDDAPDNDRNDRGYGDRRGYQARDRKSYARNENQNTSDWRNETEGEVVHAGNVENGVVHTEMVTVEPVENGSNVVVEDAKVENAADVSDKKPVEEEAVNEMTLEEYEKVLAEKRKPLEALKTVERKVVADKDFESMQRVEKKKEDDVQIKLKPEKEKLKKESADKEDKSRKSLSINEFLKPAGGGTFSRGGGRGRGARGRGRGDRGGARDEPFSSQVGVPMHPTYHIEDPGQFPVLGGAVKA